MSTPSAAGTAPPRRLAIGAFSALGAQVATLAASLPLSIIIARLTGADGTGAYGVAAGALAVGMVIFSAGLGAGLTYYVSRREWHPARAWSDARRVALGLGAAGGALVMLAAALLDGSLLRGVTTPMAISVAVALPCAVAWSYAMDVLLATERYELYGGVEAAPPVLTLVGTAILCPLFEVEGAVAALAGSYVLAFLYADARLRRAEAPAQDGPSRLRPAAGFGLRAWGADLLQLLNYRLDLFILNAYASQAVVGRYALAATLTAIGWILPTALQTVLFPRTASVAGGDEADALVASSLRHAALLTVLSGVVLAALVFAVPLVYGSAFEGTVEYALILIPGVLAIGFAKLLSAVITGRGFPQYSLYNAAVTTPLTVALYLVLIPELGGTGAAVASSASYIASTLIAAHYFRRVTGTPVLRALRSWRGVGQDYREALAGLRRFVADRRRPYDPARYWEERADDLIAIYDAPETWAERGWTRAGVEEELVPPLLEGCRSAFVVGAGSGRQYGFLAPLGLELRGIDISPSLVAECRRRYPSATTEVDTIVGAQLRHAPADAVLCTAVLQHVPPEHVGEALEAVTALAQRIVVLRELSRIRDPGSYLWAHDYDAAFAGWVAIADEVTDATDDHEVRLRAWARPS